MNPRNIHPLLLALPLALALVARANEPADQPPPGPASEPSIAGKHLPVPLFADDPVNVEIDVSFVTFDPKEIEAIARKSATAVPTQEQILKAWAAGKGRLLATSKAITIVNQQTKTEGTVTRIFPTEYEPPQVWDKQFAVSRDDWVSQPLPGGFQTRNVGLTVNAAPVISNDGKTVQVTMIPEFAEFTGWSNVEAGQIEGRRTSRMWVQQPDFYVRRATTSILVPIGGTVVSGGMPDSTGKLVTYVFLTAHLVQTSQTE